MSLPVPHTRRRTERALHGVLHGVLHLLRDVEQLSADVPTHDAQSHLERAGDHLVHARDRISRVLGDATPASAPAAIRRICAHYELEESGPFPLHVRSIWQLIRNCIGTAEAEGERLPPPTNARWRAPHLEIEIELDGSLPAPGPFLRRLADLLRPRNTDTWFE